MTVSVIFNKKNTSQLMDHAIVRDLLYESAKGAGVPDGDFEQFWLDIVTGKRRRSRPTR